MTQEGQGTVPFLSEEWFARVAEIRGGLESQEVPRAMATLDVNLTIEDSGVGAVSFHLRGAPGGFELAPGHVSGAKTEATLPYEVAKAMFVRGDLHAAMEAFLTGDIAIEGDMNSLMALQGTLESPGPSQRAFQEQVISITA